MPLVSGTFAATGTSASQKLNDGDKVNISLNFGTGTVQFQRSFDGTNFLPVSSHTADVETSYEAIGITWVRLECTSYTADIAYILGQVEPSD